LGRPENGALGSPAVADPAFFEPTTWLGVEIEAFLAVNFDVDEMLIPEVGGLSPSNDSSSIR